MKIVRFIKAVLTVYRYGSDALDRDPLTGVYNRRYFDKQHIGRKEVERAERYGSPLSVVLLDIKGFKRINDNHGLLAGDKTLKKVTDLLTRHSRKNDTIVRLGERADEFLVVMPGTERIGAERFMTRINEELAKEGISLNYGVSSWEKGLAFEQLFQEADVCLRQIKNSHYHT